MQLRFPKSTEKDGIYISILACHEEGNVRPVGITTKGFPSTKEAVFFRDASARFITDSVDLKEIYIKETSGSKAARCSHIRSVPKGSGCKVIAMYSDSLYEGGGDRISELSNPNELYPALGCLIASSLPLSAGKYEWEKKF